MKRIFLCISILFCTCVPSFAKESLSIIYIHGVNSGTFCQENSDAQNVGQAFKGKAMGDYVFNGNSRLVFWGDLYKNGESYMLYTSGLRSINTAHNGVTAKNAVWLNGKLLNPFYNIIHPKDSGSGSYTVFLRNVINGFLYQMFFVKDSGEKQNVLMQRIQAQIDKIQGKYVIVAYSFGSVEATKFIEEYIMNNPKNSKNFVGLITSADMNTVVNSNLWDTTIFKKPERNLIKYIIENDKFWICYNHRNDIAALNLPDKILNYKANGNGFILSKTTNSSLWTRAAFWNSDNGKILPHLWIILKPEDFAKKVVEAYNEHITSTQPSLKHQ